MQRKADELYALYKQLEKEWAAMRTDQFEFAKLYFGDHWAKEGGAKEGEDRITLPTHANTVDMSHALLLAQKRNIRVIPQSRDPEALRLSNEIEKFLAGVFHVNRIRSGEDVIELALWNALVKKMGCVRMLWDTALAKSETVPPAVMLAPPPQIEGAQMLPPDVQAAIAPPLPTSPLQCKELPIVLQSVPPENMVYRFGGRRGILYCFYCARRSVEDVETEIGMRLKGNKYRKLTPEDRAITMVDFLEYWGWEGEKLMMATLVDDEYIPERQHQEVDGYKFIPYFPLIAYRTPETKPNLRMRSILESMKDIVHYQEKDLTRLARMLQMFAIMPLVVQEAGGKPINIDPSLGSTIRLRQGQSVSFPVWPGTPPDFKWMLGVLEEKMQEAGFPSVTYGKGMSGASGYAITQYNEGARARLAIPRSNLALFMSQLCQGIVSLCAEYAPDVSIPVWGEYKNERFFTTLKGSDMKGHVIDVQIIDDLPGDEVRKTMMATQLRSTQALSSRTIMEKYLGVEQPEDELQQIMVEQAAQHPLLKLVAIAHALSDSQDPLMQLGAKEILKVINEMQATAAVPTNEPRPPEMGGSPTPAPQMMPTSIQPPIEQGQVLRQEMGMPPTEREVMQG